MPQDSIFENSNNGIVKDAYTAVTLSNVRVCRVSTPVTGSVSGTVTVDCTGIENGNAGTTSWALSNPATAGWPTSALSTTPEIQGFASATSVNLGSSITFYVDVRNSHPNFKIEIFRMGWYGGNGARKMRWHDSGLGVSVNQRTLTSVTQQVPTMDSTTGLIDCLATTVNGSVHTPWQSSYTLTTHADWLSGVYLAKLTTIPSSGTGKDSYIIFVVREDSRSSDLYFQTSDTTWQAYNPWGGNSVYEYPRRRDCIGTLTGNASHATKVSYNRPYAGPTCNTSLAYGTGAGEFLVQINRAPGPGWEYNALRWIEKNGFDVTYCSNIDTHQGWPSGKVTKAFLSVGHDEYWSAQMRTNVEAKRDTTSPNYVDLVFLAANVCHWRVNFDSGLRSFLVNKNGGSQAYDLWRAEGSGQLNNHEVSLVGVEYVYNSVDESIRFPTLASGNVNGYHWAYQYTGINTSTVLPNLLGYEADGCWDGTPCQDFNTQCPDWAGGTVKLAESTFIYTPNTNCTSGRSYMTMYTAASGARVFATGSMQWNWGLDSFPTGTYSGWSSKVRSEAEQMTHNVLRTFAGKSRVDLTP